MASNISVRVLDRTYQIKCSEDRVDELQEAAQYVDREMRKIRDTGKVIGLDRIAVMVAINLAHALLQTGHAEKEYVESMVQRIRELQTKIDAVLTHQDEISFE